MPQQYHASDSTTGLEVTVTGDFPEDPDDRVRIARTSNLFTRLMSTILSTDNEYERRERFRAIETQLEMADALIRGDVREVQELMRNTLTSLGVTEEQMRAAQEQLRSQLEAMGGDLSALEMLFGPAGVEATDSGAGPLDEVSMEDLTLEDLPQPEGRNSTDGEPDTPEESSDDDRGAPEA